MKKWTHLKLSESMLKRLARLKAGHYPGAGTSMAALERRGLVNITGDPYPRGYALTEAGGQALAEARREGW